MTTSRFTPETKEIMKASPPQLMLTNTNFKVLKLMDSCGYRINPDGVCVGLSKTFVMAAIIGERSKYVKRIEYINKFTTTIEKKIHGPALTEEKSDYDLIDVTAFLDGVQTNQCIFETAKQLKLKDDLNNEDFSKITQPIALEKLGGPTLVYHDAMIYNIPEWCSYLEMLSKILKEENPETSRTAIIISLLDIPESKSHREHAVNMSYDIESDHWFYFDSNLSPFVCEKATEEEAKNYFPKIFFPNESFEHSNILFLWKNFYYKSDEIRFIPATISVYTTKNNPRVSVLTKKFDKFSACPSIYCPSTSEMIHRRTISGFDLAYISAGHNVLRKIKRLSSAGFDFTKLLPGQRFLPIHLAARQNCFDVMNFFIEEKMNLNITTYSDKETIFHIISANNRVTMLEMLSEAKCNLDLSTKDGFTATHYAALKNSSDSLEFLAKWGANLQKISGEGFAAIHYAVENNSFNILHALLNPEYKIDIDQADTKAGQTAAYLAAKNNNVKALKILAEHKANLQKPLFNGVTSLHASAYLGHMESTRILLEYGVNILALDNEGNSPITFAIMQKNWHIAIWLLLHVSLSRISEKDKKLITSSKKQLKLELKKIPRDLLSGFSQAHIHSLNFCLSDFRIKSIFNKEEQSFFGAQSYEEKKSMSYGI